MARRHKRRQQRRRARPKRRTVHSINAIGSGLAVAALAGVLGWAWYAGQVPRHLLPDPPTWLPKCPVGGGPVNLAHRVATVDGPVYFCCEHCMEQFHGAPSTFDAQIELQRKEFEKLPHVQVACPVSGDPPDPAISLESPTGKILFCSPNCRDEYAGAPEQFAGELAASFWYQTNCPIDGNQINPAVRTTLPTGETVYLCSEGCRERLTLAPSTYAAQLAEAGIRLHMDR